jgi:hypothetical protein
LFEPLADDLAIANACLEKLLGLGARRVELEGPGSPSACWKPRKWMSCLILSAIARSSIRLPFRIGVDGSASLAGWVGSTQSQTSTRGCRWRAAFTSACLAALYLVRRSSQYRRNVIAHGTGMSAINGHLDSWLDGIRLDKRPPVCYARAASPTRKARLALILRGARNFTMKGVGSGGEAGVGDMEGRKCAWTTSAACCWTARTCPRA